MRSYHFIIKGKVQGVFFRAKTKEKADELGVKGWVKNTDDGSVEVLAQGEESIIHQLETWCRNGPSRARVTDLERIEVESEDFSSFNVIR